VIDLGVLFGAGPCRRLLSTRIIFVDDQTPPTGAAALGLIAEQVRDVRAVPDDRVVPPPEQLGRNPYLGAIASDVESGGLGLVPLVAVERLRAVPIVVAVEGAVEEDP
jgi:chemotaxis signal transduction protein